MVDHLYIYKHVSCPCNATHRGIALRADVHLILMLIGLHRAVREKAGGREHVCKTEEKKKKVNR